MQQEIWRSIQGFEGLYEASSFGRIRSLDKIVKSGNRFNKNISEAIKKGKILKQVDTGLGYLQVCLRKYGKNHSLYVHRLVWEAFKGPIPEGMQVNHINEIKSDNRLGNLNLVTAVQNSNWGTRNKRITETKSQKVYSKESRQGTKVAMYSLQGEFQEAFPTIAAAMRFLGKTGSSSNISGACEGKLKTAYKHLWKYL